MYSTHKLYAVANFNCRPTDDEITVMLAESNKDDDFPSTEDQIRRAIIKAEQWLHHITDIINSVFNFHGGAKDSVTVEYVEGEDLGWTCNNPGPNPFNNVYREGPTVAVCLKGFIQVRPIKEDYQIGLNFLTPNVNIEHQHSGYTIMLRVPDYKFFVAFRIKAA